jgi:hypothetical protein
MIAAPLWLLGNWRLIVALVGVAFVAVIAYRLGGINPKADLARAEARHAIQVAEWHSQVAAANAAALKRQQDLQLAVDTAREDLHHARERIREQDSRIARMSVDTSRLRDKLAAFAAGSGADDSVASCQDRAATLATAAAEGAGLLAEGADLYRQAAGVADECNAEVTALVKAWPRNHAENH